MTDPAIPADVVPGGPAKLAEKDADAPGGPANPADMADPAIPADKADDAPAAPAGLAVGNIILSSWRRRILVGGRNPSSSVSGLSVPVAACV